MRLAGWITTLSVVPALVGAFLHLRDIESRDSLMAVSGLDVLPREIVVHREASDDTNSLRRSMLQLTNRSTVPIRIDHVEAKCGCTDVSGFVSGVIPPGASKSFAVSLAIPSVGRRDTAIKIHLSDPEILDYEIPVHMFGKPVAPPYVQSMPEAIEIRETEPGKNVSREFEIVTVELSDAPAWLLDFRAIGDGLVTSSITLVSKRPYTEVAERRTYLARIQCKVPEVGVTKNTTFQVQCTRGTCSSSFRVRAICLPSIILSPASIVFDLKQVENEPDQEVFIISQLSEPFELVVDNEHRGILAIPETTGMKTAHRLRLSIDHLALSGVKLPDLVDVRLKTSVKECPVLVLPVALKSNNVSVP
jgi:hypothetical protein